MPVPNLDLLNIERLFTFSEWHSNGARYKVLFDGISPKVIPDTKWLALFAHFKAAERTMRALGDTPQAVTYQQLAEVSYGKLSPAAQWRKRK